MAKGLEKGKRPFRPRAKHCGCSEKKRLRMKVRLTELETQMTKVLEMHLGLMGSQTGLNVDSEKTGQGPLGKASAQAPKPPNPVFSESTPSDPRDPQLVLNCRYFDWAHKCAAHKGGNCPLELEAIAGMHPGPPNDLGGKS